MRRPGGFQLVLEVPARPGLFGWASDLLGITWGCRLVAVLFSGEVGGRQEFWVDSSCTVHGATG